MRRFLISAAAVAAATLGLVAPITAAQAVPAPLAISTPVDGAMIGTPPFPSSGLPTFCTLTINQAPETVTGIKGNPKATYSIEVFTSGLLNLAGSGPFITRADNGVTQFLTYSPGEPVFANPAIAGNPPITFTAELLDAAGNVVASATSVNTQGCV